MTLAQRLVEVDIVAGAEHQLPGELAAARAVGGRQKPLLQRR